MYQDGNFSDIIVSVRQSTQTDRNVMTVLASDTSFVLPKDQSKSWPRSGRLCDEREIKRTDTARREGLWPQPLARPTPSHPPPADSQPPTAEHWHSLPLVDYKTDGRHPHHLGGIHKGSACRGGRCTVCVCVKYSNHSCWMLNGCLAALPPANCAPVCFVNG